MIIILLVILYLIGCVAAFGLLTGQEHLRMLDELIIHGHTPRYKSPFESKYILFGLFGSWPVALAILFHNRQEKVNSCFETTFFEVWYMYERGGTDENNNNP